MSSMVKWCLMVVKCQGGIGTARCNGMRIGACTGQIGQKMVKNGKKRVREDLGVSNSLSLPPSLPPFTLSPSLARSSSPHFLARSLTPPPPVPHLLGRNCSPLSRPPALLPPSLFLPPSLSAHGAEPLKAITNLNQSWSKLVKFESKLVKLTPQSNNTGA